MSAKPHPELERAAQLAKNEKYSKAVSAYRNYLLFNDSTVDVHLEVARLYKKLGQPSRALNHYRICQYLDPQNESVEFEAFSLQMEIQHVHPNQNEVIDSEECQKLNDEANNFLLMDQPEKALEKLEEALKLDDSYYSLWNNKGMSHHKLGNYELAMDSYSKALKLQPDYGLAMYNLATTFIKMERHAAAVEFLEGSISIDDGDADVWYNLGFCYMKMDQPEKAVPCFLEVLEIRANHISAHYSLAQANALLRNEKMALLFLKAVLDVRPEWLAFVKDEAAFDWLRTLPSFNAAVSS